MPLLYHPRPGEIVICDYSTGFIPPEMVKVRPVVVISPRRRASNLVTVVPISSKAPIPVEPWHYLLPTGAYPPARGAVWVKCDMLATVALGRLEQVKAPNGRGGRYEAICLGAVELAAVYRAVRAALGLT